MSDRGRKTGQQQTGNSTTRGATKNLSNQKTTTANTKNVKPDENKKTLAQNKNFKMTPRANNTPTTLKPKETKKPNTPENKNIKGKNPPKGVTTPSMSKDDKKVKTGTVSEPKNAKTGKTTQAGKNKENAGSSKKSPVGKDVKTAVPQKPGANKVRAAPMRGRRGKLRISPEEMRRRQLAEYLKAQGFLLGLRSTLAPPPEPFCRKRELEFQREYQAYKYKKEMEQIRQRIMESQKRAHENHCSEVRNQHKYVVLKRQQNAIEADQRLEQRFTSLENKRLAEQRELTRKLHAERMKEIEIQEKLNREQKIRRQDEERVIRLLKSKYKIPEMFA